MNPITYSLKESQPDSEMYYFSIAAFTDKVLKKAENILQSAVDFYGSNYAHIEEAYLELLIMGIYWRIYGRAAAGLGKTPGRLLAAISKLRGTRDEFKAAIDFLKGILSTIFLYGKATEQLPSLKYNAENLGVLAAWLEAAGEFKQEVKRLNKWKDCLNQLPENEAGKIIASAVSFAGWFEKQSMEHLDVYTPNVGQFLDHELPGHRWHEDMIFCGRRKVEYHLNMVGAEIMNRIYRDEFKRTNEKVLLLPTCMRNPESGKCLSRSRGRGFICMGCSKNCSVNSLTRLCESEGVQVKMVPHESSIAAARTDESLFDSGCGVIGVSCVLNLISGGWMLIEKGTVPQCVILDYCGCKNHWHREGLHTTINEKQLMKILNG